MSINLSNLLRKIFLSSIAGIVSANPSLAKDRITFFEPGEDNKSESLLNKIPDLTPKLLLKKSIDNEWSVMSHRSHRSHSSHRSHYSSYSGSGGGSSTPNSTPQARPAYGGNSSSSNYGTTTTSLQLGARTLIKGMSGTDVTELVNILLRKKYLKLDDGGIQVSGSYMFDEIIKNAVRKFQTDNGLSSDGICGPTTIYYLKNR